MAQWSLPVSRPVSFIAIQHDGQIKSGPLNQKPALRPEQRLRCSSRARLPSGGRRLWSLLRPGGHLSGRLSTVTDKLWAAWRVGTD